MSTPKIGTGTNDYPQEEVDAMMEFYDGQRCVITNAVMAIDWCHILDGAISSSNPRLTDMLRRNLREDRHPEHAAEVRENLVPVKCDHHDSMNHNPGRTTLFLHEDVVERTLAYERELQEWRIAEIKAGRTDPGRPTYDQAFGGEKVTEHRYYCESVFYS